ncbi:CsgG/HfaB family protein [Maritimibacter sp. HL-12]|uniref:CsgG/HfaB family protein n=1 Tax=Maritimibacter sp. HL-12 TaxID=1162418 RepID=UPI000A0F284F|nr:CsgG/HfaB family protein [Maritimibacter sp. HL-12]SMH51209.1 Curli production assembly/transport component CsgG [Maritimibacter sp. HL-12]
MALSACAVDPGDESLSKQVPVIEGPAPYITKTAAEDALLCVSEKRPKGRDLRIGIGDISDGTGARTYTDGSSTLLTQRPDLMVAVAMQKTGLRIMNRNAVKVAEWEIAQAMEQRLGEGYPTVVDGEEYSFRPVQAGAMLGTTHFITGALTEVNHNISSRGSDVNIVGAFNSSRTYHISVAVDLIVTNTKTTEIELARSYSKQIVGREVSQGLLRFFDITQLGPLGPVELFDVNVGKQNNEPVQTAVRWLLEVASFDIAASLTRTKDACISELVRLPEVAAEPAKSADL